MGRINDRDTECNELSYFTLSLNTVYCLVLIPLQFLLVNSLPYELVGIKETPEAFTEGNS
jgi:hypothetical protein